MTDFKTIDCLEGAEYIPENILVTGGAGTFQNSARQDNAPRGPTTVEPLNFMMGILRLS